MTSTDRADVLEYFTSTFASSASILDLHLHRSHLHNFIYNSVPVTLRASFLFAAFSTSTMASFTVDISVHTYAFIVALIQLQ